MNLKIYSKQFLKQFSIDSTPNMNMKQVIDQITQYFGCNDATLTTASINDKILSNDLTLEELKIGQDCQITLFLQYCEHIKFQLKHNKKQIQTLEINIYNSIQEVEEQLTKYFKIEYDVKIIVNDQKISKTLPFSQLDLNKTHEYEINVYLQIEMNNNQQKLLDFSVFDKISDIKQKIIEQMQIKGEFQILYNIGILLDTIENMEETIYSLQIPNYQTLKIHSLQQINLKYIFNNFSEQYKVKINQKLIDCINQLRKKHKYSTNYINNIKCNEQLQTLNTISLEQMKQYQIEIEENKDETINITIINYFDLANRELKIYNINQNLDELKNEIKQKNDNCPNVEFIINERCLETDSKTLQQVGFVVNTHYCLQYKCINDDNQHQKFSQKINQLDKPSQTFICNNKQNLIGNNQQQILAKSDAKIQYVYDQIEGSNPIERSSGLYDNQFSKYKYHNSDRITEKSLFNHLSLSQEELRTEDQNIITIIIIMKLNDKNFEQPQKIKENQYTILSQTQSYKDLLAKGKTNITLKFEGENIDVEKSFKDLGISNDSMIEVIIQSDDILSSQINQQNQNDESIQLESSQINEKVKIQFQFQKDGIQRNEFKIYNKETIKFSLIRKQLLIEYQLPENLEIIYKDKKVDLNSNISSILQEGEFLFILKGQENLINKKLVNLNLILIDGPSENQKIQVDQYIEISNLFNLVEQKLNQTNLKLYYEGSEISNQKETYLTLKDDGENEVEVVV
ncbi:unnamed protein product [Paramecium pentaurelia]|uniref:Rad60/SUMO-like domain-containing protein n=1 Tax=Paramecium pentaurelia TaxID=43138 RepID=A0A8S1TWY7_9CILI|nr:unnamed protein product [Paramecium pentaurelia]